ncbi:MAG: SMI1/KNR4 family protein, partial [Planctomycetaceae bacterium]|nr:SMI1/KNR4 family protein [Planctomycetaceae bacterium]
MAREFEQLIERNQNWFRGPQPVSEEELDQAEQRLQVSFPQTFRWLLNQCGYWRATGVASL